METTNINLQQLTSIAKKASLEAGKAILTVYQNADIGLEVKDDQSPLTLADKAAHDVISQHLNVTGLPILSEEGRTIPYDERKNWTYFWLVDPLDGTKEFVKKNGEFTVNIALMYKNRPIMGVIYAPVLKWIYWGSEENGAWKQVGSEDPIRLVPLEEQEVKTIVASRSHLNQETKEIIDKYPGAETITMGSSLKFMLIAENKAQLYPRLAPTMEWDTGSAHGILIALNCQLFQMGGNEVLIYNKENLLNPSFIAGISRN
ncbi:3'(2'),5'-bisphosphate nucleotidase CysQ [Lunatibacter salilacus]|uniref:3'(2'),5'-bisphosphate nucleotidase CysQ n=1 Tax=Lunatibacter salilacus TaxID=2483804 RepID=UPI0018FE99A5|nr:3'(2'),5'-bisphosphate nucleotidase CysQ [Lunatibacter salilacus]